MLSRVRSAAGSIPWNWSAAALIGAAWTNACLDERGLKATSVVYLGGSAGVGPGAGGGESGAGAAGDTEGGASNGGSAGGSGGPFVVGGGGGATGGTSGAQSGSAGSGAPTGGLGGHEDARCPDLDANTVLDCDETILKNAGYQGDDLTKSWSSDTNVELTWNSKDGQDHDESGALAVTNQSVGTMDGNTMAGGYQCVAVSGGTVYRFAVQISVPDYAGDTKGGMQLLFFDNQACGGELLDHPTTNFVKGEAWKLADLLYLTPPTARSAQIRLVVTKPFRQTPLPVLFDNVLVHTD